MINDMVDDDERLLIMPMLYRNNPNNPDPIVSWRLSVSPQILRSMNPDLTYKEFRELVISKKVHWVLMAPAEGNSHEKLAERLRQEILPRGRAFSRGILARVAPLWKKGPQL